MAANDFTTMTPGSGVADALQDILTRKRNDARQAMLDDITKRATDARIRYEDETAKSMAVAREGRAEEQRSLAAKNMLAGLGDAPAPLDQETYNKIHQYAPTRVSMTPAQNTLPSTQFSDAGVQQVPATPAPASYRYNGSPAYQQRQDTQKGLEGLANDPSFARLDDLHKLLKISSLFPQANPEAAIERLLTSKTEKGDGHLYGVDPATHKRIDLGPIGPNDRSMEFSRAPQTPAGEMPYVTGTKEDPVTHKKSPATFRISPSMIGPDGLVKYPEGFTPEGKLSAPPRTTLNPNTLYGQKQVAALRSAFQRSGNSTPVRQGREIAEADFINSISDPDLKKDIMTIRSDKRARMTPVEDLLKLVTPPASMQDEESKAAYLSAIRSILTELPNYPRLADQ
jgi:hypothetical protein